MFPCLGTSQNLTTLHRRARHSQKSSRERFLTARRSRTTNRKISVVNPRCYGKTLWTRQKTETGRSHHYLHKSRGESSKAVSLSENSNAQHYWRGSKGALKEGVLYSSFGEAVAASVCGCRPITE